MIASFRRADGLALVAGTAVVAGTFAAAVVFKGSPLATDTLYALTGIVAGCALTALVVVAMRMPLVFPLALYAALLPLDNALSYGEGTATRALGGLSAIVVAVALIARRRVVRPRPETIGWAVIVLWMLASLLWSPEGRQPGEMFGQIVQLFGLYAIVAMYPANDRDVRLLTFAIVAGGVLAAIYALALVASGFSSLDGRVWVGSGTARVDPNHFAAALQLSLALGVQAMFSLRGRIARLAAGAAVLVTIAGVLLSGSRGGALAMLALVLYLGVRNRRYVETAALAALGFALSFAVPAVWQRILDPTQGEGAGRTSIWETGWVAFRENWLIGTGIGSFPDAYDRYVLDVFQRPFAGWHRVSHNLLLGSAVEIGLVGLVGLVTVFLLQARSLRSIAPTFSLYRSRVACEGAFLALFIESMFLDVLNLKYFWLTFIFAAVVIAASVRPDAASPLALEGDEGRTGS